MSKTADDTSRKSGARKGRSGKILVIVESPAKAKTINKYLGSGYHVEASMGHVRDLPARDLGIDLSNGFAPTYQNLTSRKKLLSSLKKAADSAPQVYLATDLDREGEAIAWHLVEALGLPPEKVRRVIFNEITKSAIQQAFEKPHILDLDKVNAQQARRILDRIMGYQLSPLLWRKIAKGLSAGRVQSVAVRLIVEREREIRAFIPQEYWRIMGCFALRPEDAESRAKDWLDFLEASEEPGNRTEKDKVAWCGDNQCIRAELTQLNGEEFKPTTAAEARRVAEALGFVCREQIEEPWADYPHLNLKLVRLPGAIDPSKSPAHRIASVTTKRTSNNPPGPFTTATLQQAASTRLGFGASRTMRVAQQLYEGLDVGKEGSVGLITYMRTDSTNLSKDSVSSVRDWIGSNCGSQYVPDKPNRFGKAKRAQEAHEAIRPSDPTRSPDAIKGNLTRDQWRLYDLIWRRFVACQMPPAQWDSTTILIEADSEAGTATFKASGRKLIFDGYLRIAGMSTSGGEQLLPDLAEDQPLAPVAVEPGQHFTSPPPRFTEASLVKTLESEGIGRPSTYAAIIQTIQDRGYTEQQDRRFHATSLGEVVTDKLVQHFPDIINVKFTSQMEDNLDRIEESHMDWVAVLEEFYDPFSADLAKAGEEMEPAKAAPSEYECKECGKQMLYRWGKNGRFLSCSGYPDCKTTMNVDGNGEPIEVKPSGVKCEKCGKDMILRRSRNGPFLGCSGYPDCDKTLPCDDEGQPLKLVKEEDIRETCEQCDSPMAVKWRGRRAFLGCSAYPKCRNTSQLPPDVYLEPPPQPEPEPAGFNCEKCARPMIVRTGRRGKFISCSGFPKCRNAKPIEKLEELKAAAEKSGQTTPAAGADTSVPFDTDDEVSAKTSDKAAGKKATPVKGATSGPVEDGAVPNNEGNVGVRLTKSGKLAIDSLEKPVNCPSCGSAMSLKRGPWGPFLSCEGFPKCKTTGRLNKKAMEQAEQELGPAPAKPKPKPTDIDCDQCGAKMVIRTGRSGEFLSCSSFPKCRNAKPLPANGATTATPSSSSSS